MKTVFFLFLSLLLSATVFCRAYKECKLPDNERPLKVFSYKKENILATDKGFYKITEKALVNLWRSPAFINAIVEDDTCYWVASNQGLILLNKKNLISTYLDIPALIKRPPVTAVIKDAGNAVWVGCEAYGMFKFEGGHLNHKYSVFPVISAAYTADSSLWVGTMSGLNRFHKGEQIRFNEEGVANFEIPGNIVDQLLIDNVGHLWVITNEGICVFGLNSGDGHGHLPTVKFLGSPDNKISSIVYLSKTGYLFTTSMGLLLLPEREAEHVEALEEPQSDKVENKALLRKVTIRKQSNYDMVQQDKKYFWLCSNQQILKLSLKEMKNAMKESY